MSSKGKGKRTRQEAFADENKVEAQVLASLATEKHARKMAEHQQKMKELEIKKHRLTQEADEKKLQAQYQREREKEAHEMQMLRLRLQYQGASENTMSRNLRFGPLSPPSADFADPSAFGGVVGMDTFPNGILPFNT